MYVLCLILNYSIDDTHCRHSLCTAWQQCAGSPTRLVNEYMLREQARQIQNGTPLVSSRCILQHINHLTLPLSHKTHFPARLIAYDTHGLLQLRKLSQSRLLQNWRRGRSNLLIDKFVSAGHRSDKHDIVLEHLCLIELLAAHEQRLTLTILRRHGLLLVRPFRSALLKC